MTSTAPESARMTAHLTRRGLLQTALASGLAVAGLSACGGDEGEPELARTAARQALAQGLVGVAMGWVEPGWVAAPLLSVAGLRQLGGTRLQRDDALYIGSNGKAMTAMVIARLVDQGRLAWSDRVLDRLPGLADTLRADYAAVTLAQWLDHLGGVVPLNGSSDDEARFLADLSPDPAPWPDTLPGRRVYLARWVLQQAPVDGVRPGQDFAYSNGGYLIAAAMAEAATGQDFEALMQSELAEPLGLTLVTSAASGAASEPAGHEGDSPATLAPVEPLPADQALWWQALAPAGFWACPPSSYARWLDTLGAALRGEATALPESAVARLRGLADGRYALGWVAQAQPQPLGTFLVHSGHAPGFMALAAVDAAGRWAGFGLSNTAWMDASGDSWVLAALNAQLLAMAQQRGRLPR